MISISSSIQLNVEFWGVWHWISFFFQFINHYWVLSCIQWFKVLYTQVIDDPNLWFNYSMVFNFYKLQYLLQCIPDIFTSTDLKLNSKFLLSLLKYICFPIFTSCLNMCLSHYILFAECKTYVLLLCLCCILDTRTLRKWMNTWMMI